LDAGFAGRRPLAEALGEYEQQRNAFAFPMYELICQLAAMEPPPPEMQALIGAMIGNEAAKTEFFGVLDGTVSAAAFFAPDNLGRIMAAAGAPAAPA
jgi:hypothetical protein